MNISDILILRQEFFLFGILILLLLYKLVASNSSINRGIIFGINILMAINIIMGFLNTSYGNLFGGMFQSNATIVLEKNLLAIGTLIICMQASDWTNTFKNNVEYYFILIATLLGMDIMISSGHFTIFYIGFELASLPLAALVSFNKAEKSSAEAGIKMILMSGFSSCILLFGISLLYGLSGTLLFDKMVAIHFDGSLSVLAFLFIFAGFGFKLSIVPFHLWTADVYEGAPINVTSFLSVISKSATVFIFLTILYKVFGSFNTTWIYALSLTTVFSITIGNLFALRQTNLKRFLAFSSIAQAGFILLGMISGSNLAMGSVLYFIFIYIFSNLAAFGVLGILHHQNGKDSILDLSGLYKRNPFLGIVMVLAMLSLAGVPPTAGFFGKFFLLNSAMSKGYYLITAIAVLNMIISLYYYLRIVRIIFTDATEEQSLITAGSWLGKLSLVFCIIGIIAIGFIGDLFEYFNYLSFGI